jgi:proline iminopeptidase
VSERYPPIEPYASGQLDVGDGQAVYWEEVGNPDGLPAVFLHGGPGGGCSANARRYFDPARYRAVLFDQRGCGRSTPSASDPAVDLSTNTTDHLVADIERIREHLGIDAWHVVGVSWGVTLGLVYAERHPDRVRALILGAVTSGAQRELDWITRDIGRVFPREWDRFVSLVPHVRESGNVPAAYQTLLSDPDPEVREEAAREWCAWEDTHVSLMPGWQPTFQTDPLDAQYLFARLVTHYWGNGCFIEPDEVIRNLDRVVHLPGVMVHGRYDVSGPLETAWRLHQAWPGSELVVIDDAGHGGGSFVGEIVAGLDRLAR